MLILAIMLKTAGAMPVLRLLVYLWGPNRLADWHSPDGITEISAGCRGTSLGFRTYGKASSLLVRGFKFILYYLEPLVV